jgi:4'-phosphopantetheinyl transferase EntD
LLDFDPSGFDRSEFDRSGIVLPDSVASSVRRRQAEFFYGRLAARIALERIGIAAKELPIGAMREPLWPNGVIGSITHCDGWAAAAVEVLGAPGGLGIDIERIVDVDRMDAVLDSAVLPGERVLLRSIAPSLSLQLLTTLVFSAKESLFKAAFPSVRRLFDFDAARTVALDADACQLRLCLCEELGPEFRRGREFAVDFRVIAPDVVLTSCAW